MATKLFLPRPRPALVVRPRLLRLLAGAATAPLTLVSAPAGFGKTTLAAAWAQQQPLPLAWLTLDPADNDPQRFLHYLVAALQTVQLEIGRDLNVTMEAGHVPPIEAAIIMLANDLAALPQDLLLALDDLHLIDAPAIEAALQTLVEHQPPQLHLLILTREDPPLPLARLRARGQLVEVRAGDLRFTPDESAAFLGQVMGLALSPQQVADLDARIEGWVAGLQLAGLSLQKSADPAGLIADLSSSHHFILTYLTEEVLRRQPPDVQDFLLQTSILARLSPSLCDAVCARSDSATLLNSLYAANTFVVPLDDEHTWFRYHHLFGELLRNQLQRTQPGLVANLHQRAASWFTAQAQPLDAIEHALLAGDDAAAAALLEVYARPLVLRGYAQTVTGWLQRLPPEWRGGGPHTNVAFAWSALLRGQLGEIESHLANAEAGLDAAESGAQSSLRAEILALRAALVSLRGDPERACDLAAAAVALAPAEDVYVQGATRFCLATAYNYAGRTAAAIDAYQAALPFCRAAGNAVAAMLIAANLALLMIERGQLHAAADLSREIIAEAGRTRAQHSPALASVYGAYAQVLYEWDELDAAYAEAQRAVALGQRSGHLAAIAYGSVVLSRIQAARSEWAEASQLLAAALQLRERAMPAWVLAHMVSQQVSMALARNDKEAAQQALAGSGVAIADATDHTREVVHLAWLRLLLHQLCREPTHDLRWSQAQQLAGKLIVSAEKGGRASRVIEALNLRALLWEAQGKQAAAQVDLERALQLSAPGGYVRAFTGLGAAMAQLLAALAAPPELQAYVERLRGAFPKAMDNVPAAPDPADQDALIEPLSEREIEVLRLMAAGLTYQEVADRLIVSLNTVRFHVKSIYGKLGVDNRTAALEQARRLHLL